MLKHSGKEHFVDVTDYSVLTATVDYSGDEHSIVALQEFASDDINELKREIKNFFRSKSNYIPAHCIVHPPSSFIRKYALEVPARARDSSYLLQVLRDEFSIDPEKFKIKVLNASNGLGFNADIALEKELVFCGGDQEDLDRHQDLLIRLGFFPNIMELGPLSMIGGLLNYTASNRTPTLVLDIGTDSSQVAVVFRNQLDLIRPIAFGINNMIPLIQKELAFEDEASARQLLFSNTFDFTEKGPVFLKKLIKEIQTSIDYYEVQTGQTVDSLFIGALPKALSWVKNVLSSSLNLQDVSIDFGQWLSLNELSVADDVSLAKIDPRWLSLFSLIISRSTSHPGGSV